jgi:hypothetical protein
MTGSGAIRHGVAVLTIPAGDGALWDAVGGANHAGNSCDGLVEVIELLSAANYPFDIIDSRRITLETFLDGKTVKYSSILILTPLLHLPPEADRILREISYTHGVSLICSLGGAVPEEAPAWGIRKIGKSRPLWPLHIKINNCPGWELKDDIIAKYYPWAGLAGVRTRGFKKLDLRRVTQKFFCLLTESFIPFRRVSLDKETINLAESPEGLSLVHSFKYGRATNYCFAIGFHKLLARYNEMHRLVRSAIEVNSGFGMVSVDLDGTMALRIDDPGACVSDYLEGPGRPLTANEWVFVGEWLTKMGFSASVVYTPQWVDDGDSDTGTLYVDGRKVERRTAGQAFPSPSVRYFSNKKSMISDHENEFKGLLRVKTSGIIDIQSHGLTHILREHEKWALSQDRSRNSRWYYEYYNAVDDKPIDAASQMMSMSDSRQEIARFYESAPCVLTPSGHRHGDDSDIHAFRAGYLVFSSDFTSYKNKNIVIRNSKIPGLFLLFKNPNDCFSRSGYPFVGILHDRDLLNPGLKHLENVIHGWLRRGIKRVISLKDLTASLCLRLKSSYSPCPPTLRIEVELPAHDQGSAASNFTGTHIALQIVLPDGLSFDRDSEILSRDERVISYGIKNKRIIQLILQFGENYKYELTLPLLMARES